MAKRSIYFQEHLEAQMDRFPDENWSAVCQDGVTARLKFLELKSEATASAVERAKARLAADKAAYVADAGERGARAGAAWAADTATFDELRRLKMHREDLEFIDDSDDELKSAKNLVWVLRHDDDDEPDIDDALGFCTEAGLNPYQDRDGDVTSGEFWTAFVEAALSIYDQI